VLIHAAAPVWMPQAPVSPTAVRRFAGGCCEGLDTPQGFVVQRIISTDPADYLSPHCYPGAVLPPEPKQTR